MVGEQSLGDRGSKESVCVCGTCDLDTGRTMVRTSQLRGGKGGGRIKCVRRRGKRENFNEKAHCQALGGGVELCMCVFCLKRDDGDS